LCISIGLKTASKSHQNALISATNFKKNFWGGAQPPPQTPPAMGRRTPPPHTNPPRGLWPLAPRGLRPLTRRLKSRPRSHFQKSAPMILTTHTGRPSLRSTNARLAGSQAESKPVVVTIQYQI